MEWIVSKHYFDVWLSGRANDFWNESLDLFRPTSVLAWYVSRDTYLLEKCIDLKARFSLLSIFIFSVALNSHRYSGHLVFVLRFFFFVTHKVKWGSFLNDTQQGVYEEAVKQTSVFWVGPTYGSSSRLFLMSVRKKITSIVSALW